MNDSGIEALRRALEEDPSLQARFAAAGTPEDVVRLAADAGIRLDVADLAERKPLTDEDLASVSGGYTFPATDWIYCDNPWTNYWCTLKC